MAHAALVSAVIEEREHMHAIPSIRPFEGLPV